MTETTATRPGIATGAGAAADLMAEAEATATSVAERNGRSVIDVDVIYEGDEPGGAIRQVGTGVLVGNADGGGAAYRRAHGADYHAGRLVTLIDGKGRSLPSYGRSEAECLWQLIDALAQWGYRLRQLDGVSVWTLLSSEEAE